LKILPNATAVLSISATTRLDKVVIRLQALMAMLVVLPFALWRVAQQQYVLAGIGLGAGALLGALGLLSLNERRFDRVARYVLPLVVLGQMLAIAGMVALGGPETKTWAFPVIVSSFLLLRAREATLISLSCSALDAWLAYLHTGALRDSAIFFACCLLVVLFTHLFSSRLHADNLRLKSRSLQDALTGVGNRRLLDDTLATLVAQPPAGGMTLILFDLDHFKRINDRFGHVVGDLCLQRFAKAVSAQLGSADALYRFGGEEFVLLTPCDAQQAMVLAENIRAYVAQTTIIRETRFTLSAGVAQLLPGQSVRDWVNRADAALYQAKESGRNRVLLAAGATATPSPAASA
jgi:diguanylate cyclase (GGDEF)-like protein